MFNMSTTIIFLFVLFFQTCSCLVCIYMYLVLPHQDERSDVLPFNPFWRYDESWTKAISRIARPHHYCWCLKYILFFFKTFFQHIFSYYIYIYVCVCICVYIYIYSLVGFGALCALGAAGVFENLWKLIFRNSVFIYFWDLRHAVIGGRTISACPGLTWDQDMQICFSQGLSHVCFSLYGSGMYCPIGMQYKYSQEHIGMAGQDIPACPGLRWDQDMQIYPGQQFLHVLNIKK